MENSLIPRFHNANQNVRDNKIKETIKDIDTIFPFFVGLFKKLVSYGLEVEKKLVNKSHQKVGRIYLPKYKIYINCILDLYFLYLYAMLRNVPA